MCLSGLLCVHGRQCWGEGFVGWEIHFHVSFLPLICPPLPLISALGFLLSAAFLFCYIVPAALHPSSLHFPFSPAWLTRLPLPLAPVGCGSGSGRCPDAEKCPALGRLWKALLLSPLLPPQPCHLLPTRGRSRPPLLHGALCELALSNRADRLPLPRHVSSPGLPENCQI